MKTVEKTIEVSPDEQVVTTVSSQTTQQADTKTVVIAVGASVILFVVGMVLGFLLGRASVPSTQSRDGYSMMRGDKDNIRMMPMYRNSQNGAAQQNTSTNTQVPTQ